MQTDISRWLVWGCLLLLTFGCAAKSERLTQNEIGGHVETVLRNAVCIEFIVNVHQIALKDGIKLASGTDPVMCKSVMAKNAFRSEVFKADKLIAAYSLVDGRTQEYRPRQKHRPLFEYDAPHINGIDDCVLHEAEDCLVGTAISNSWVGVSSGPAEINNGLWLRTQIEQGVQQADTVEHGHDCYVFYNEFSIDVGAIRHVLYINKQTFLVVRWDTFEPGVQRIRTYDISLLPEVPKNFDWKIKVPKKSLLHDAPDGTEWEIKPAE
ncbi:MAG: hypothetical protein WCK93_12825 [Nitrosomonadales bacterium]